MKDNAKNDNAGKVEDTFQIYDPDNPPFEKLCICDIIRDLPELTDDETSRYHDG